MKYHLNLVKDFFLFILSLVIQHNHVSCHQNKIINGTEAPKGRYPYQVALLTGVDFDFQFCGGTLIHPDWILTAAHCSPPREYVAHINHHNLSDATNGGDDYEVIGVDFEVRHPRFDSGTLNYDFMLLKLNASSTFPLVTLDDGTANLTSGVDVTVMGWGFINNDGEQGPIESSDILLETELDVVDNDVCKAVYDFFYSFFDQENEDLNFYQVTDENMCAARDGTGFCQGDSGGALILKGDNATTDVQVGIVSWALGCAREATPSVLARISEAQDFINSTLSCAMPSNFNSSDCCGVNCVNGTFVCERSIFPDDGFDYSECNVQSRCRVGDGRCDRRGCYNDQECNYDGGDCCEETCVDGEYDCEHNDFRCRNPDFRWKSSSAKNDFLDYMQYFVEKLSL